MYEIEVGAITVPVGGRGEGDSRARAYCWQAEVGPVAGEWCSVSALVAGLLSGPWGSARGAVGRRPGGRVRRGAR
jgi:hypothetical protein